MNALFIVMFKFHHKPILYFSSQRRMRAAGNEGRVVHKNQSRIGLKLTTVAQSHAGYGRVAAQGAPANATCSDTVTH